MKAIQLLFLFFLAVPFVEIYVLLQVGGLIGAFPTIFLVVFTAALGAWLLRRQGFATWQRFQANLAQGNIPAYEMIEGPILLVGGALLLTPGFFTDILGFACLIPALRRKIAQYIIENHLLVSEAGGVFRQTKSQDPNIIEGEYRKDDTNV
ncbi:FxsA family protein [Methylomonas sp. LL1]|uniref:FxsA family protein n=1 Tax=Methylomonas sp. LL1 TaxID=2785785 RepID=UPI0018C42D4C|nr:FxsA family protein [Methylomonas sp. LL1]QPK61947.1 FxsA family protein [Methylomonas sp. LL1]